MANPAMPRGFRNAPLLRFLAAVDHHAHTGAPLSECSGYDAAELGVAVGTARTRGFVSDAGAECGLALTPAGLAWAIEELAPFAGLLTSADRRAAA